MDNTLKLRVNKELLDFYKGNPDTMREALILYMRSKQKFIEVYESTEK